MNNENNGLTKGKSEILTIQMGPQHPSTHGVLHLEVELDGEVIQKVDPDCGYLHRAVEKMTENRPYQQSLPLIDRLDYLSPYTNDWGYAMLIEKALGWEIPERAEYIRVIVGELSRIASHLVWLATHAIDIGAMTVFLYCFREREKLLDIFDELSGQRMNSTYFIVGGVRQDLTPKSYDMIESFLDGIEEAIQGYETLLNRNRIWLGRTKDIGVITGEEAINYGLSGPMMRGSGVAHDLRITNPYSIYNQLDFDIITEEGCDTYARYRVRLGEMRESMKIVKQAIGKIPKGRVLYSTAKPDATPDQYPELDKKAKMMLMNGNTIKPQPGETSVSVEAPRGELAFHLISVGGNQPYRIKIRVPSFINLAAIPKLSKGHTLADLIAVIGTIDIVLGECDK